LKVARAEAERIAAEHDLARHEELHALGELPQRDVDGVLADTRVARARAARARAVAEWAANDDAGDPSDDIALEYSLLVRAPCDGVVLAAPDVGARVEAGVDLFVLGERAAR
jgi:multidrug resistance efflux pump